MASISKMIIIGNLGSDPETRYSQGGTAICNLRVAVTDRRKEGDNFTDHTEWFTVVCFGKVAENAQKFLKKGRQIFAEGRFQARKWIDRDNITKTNLEIVCEKLLFLGSQKEESNSSTNNLQTLSQSFDPADSYLSEDVPF